LGINESSRECKESPKGSYCLSEVAFPMQTYQIKPEWSEGAHSRALD